MNGYFIRLLFWVLILGWPHESAAQVRVKRAHTKKFETRPKRRAAKDEDQTRSPRKKKKEITTRVKAANIPELRNTLDARFYVKWHIKRKLVYGDFNYNRNLYNKFLAASDTDLTREIYPDYIAFYKRLSERHQTEQQYADSIWNVKAELMLRNAIQSSDGIYETSSIDSAVMMPITIDSPAASVINITPIIYAVGSNSYYYNITPLLSKQESWMIVKAKDILEHEQIHFDIFELYARKMRRHVIETIRENYKEGTQHEIADEMAPAMEQLYQQLNNLQLEFDRQTAALTATNSSLIKTNAIWQRAMQQQLEELKEYALPEGTIILN